MMNGWLQLLKAPRTYFDAFDDAAPSWQVTYACFYLVCFVESIGNLAFSDSSPPASYVLRRSLIGALSGAVLNGLFFGVLWMWVGSKLVRGKASLVITTKACGYAFLYPSIVALLTVPAMLWLSAMPDDSLLFAFALLGTVVIQLVAGLWSLGVALLAVKSLNGFGWGKTLVVAIWLPSLLVVVILGVMAFR